MTVRVLGHFAPSDKVLKFLAPHADWLDVAFCAEDDDDTFHRALPEAEVLWHVLRPLSGEDVERAGRCRLIHKLGAGVNTIGVAAATRSGIAVANMPGANAPSVAEGTVLLMLAALRRLPELDRLTRAGLGWPHSARPHPTRLSAQVPSFPTDRLIDGGNECQSRSCPSTLTWPNRCVPSSSG